MNQGNHRIRRPQLSLHVTASRTRGFSLLEIMVVLIILLIGILSVLRLFPGGFLTIQRTADQTMGVNLAGEQMNRSRTQPAQPDFFVPGLPDDKGNIHPIFNIRPDDLSIETDTSIVQYATAAGFTLFPGYPGYFFSDINRIRYVIGDPFYIPISNPNIVDTNGVPYGSLQALQYGPVYNQFYTNGPLTNDSLQVYGTPLSRALGSSVSTLNTADPRALLRNENEYAIDYANSKIAFFPRVGLPVAPGMLETYRDFQIVFNYYDTSTNPPTLKPQTGKPIIRVYDIDPATLGPGVAPQPVWQNIFDPTNNPAPANAQLQQESEDVSRMFKLILTDNKGNSPVLTFQNNLNAPAWSNDPYEYAWYSPQSAGINANTGVLVFNPRGHLSFLTNGVTNINSQAQAQPYTNTQSIVARVDYLIYDNHIIRDQRTVPSNGPYTIKLSLPNIRTNGDLQEDGSVYSGIFQGTGATTNDIIILNANDGTEISAMSQGTLANANDVPFTLDTVTGTITFAATSATGKGIEDLQLQGRPLRILYRTQKNWGEQVQKASSMYSSVSTPSAITYKTYFVGDGTNGATTRIYFSQSEAGKTVTLGEFYLKASTGIIYTPYKNEAFKLPDQPSSFESVNGNLYPYIDILTTHNTADAQHITQGGAATDPITGFTGAPTGRAISNLRGLSIKSRVIWKSSGRFLQIDQDSVLPTERLQNATH